MIDFPSSPSLNQTYTYGDTTWKWNGDGWEVVPNSLSPADIPDLDASKITSGTLPVARGGTGLSSLATGNFLRAASSSTLELRTPAQVLSDIGALASSSYTAADVLAKLITVDGTGSGLDADLLDGQHGSYYAPIDSAPLTGTPTAPTAALNTNTTQIATTAYVLAAIADDAPTKTGTGASGTWSISITGTAANATNATNASILLAVDDRDVKPDATGIHNIRAIKPFFVAKEQIEGGAGSSYGDFLVLDTYTDNSGGAVNGLFFAKGGTQAIYHYKGAWNTSAWDAPKQVAYTDSNITGNAASATILQTARTIAISGPVTGTATSFNGSANITIPVTAVDVGHANITGTLGVDHGGTGIASYTTGNYIRASAATTLEQRTPAQVLSDIGAAASGHNHTLDSLSNVTITSNTNGEILRWNGTAWVNNTLAEAGIQPAGSYLTGNQTITLSGDVTGSGATSITTTIANNAVTLAKLADIATSSFIGRVTAATGDPEVLTATQATSLLNTFTTSLKGLAPASGGGTTNFLRADGTWAVPTATWGNITGTLSSQTDLNTALNDRITFYAQDTAPTSPPSGAKVKWLDTANWILYTWYSDGTSAQWVEI